MLWADEKQKALRPHRRFLGWTRTWPSHELQAGHGRPASFPHQAGGLRATLEGLIKHTEDLQEEIGFAEEVVQA